MFSKVYCFLARALFLLPDHVSSKYTEQTVKRYHRIPLDFPQILLTTNNIFFLLFFFGFFCCPICFSFFSFFFFFCCPVCFSFFCFFFCVCFFLFETNNIYCDTRLNMRAVSDEKVFTLPIFGNRATFFWPKVHVFK